MLKSADKKIAQRDKNSRPQKVPTWVMAAYHLTGQDSQVKNAWLAVLAQPVWHWPFVLVTVFAIPLYIAHIVYVGALNRDDRLGSAVDKMSGTAARMTLFVAILITVATGLLPLADFPRLRP